MRTEKGEGIIWRKTIYSDADIIFEIFSKEMGKISILAKGIRKQKSKNIGIMTLFSYIEYEVFNFSSENNFFRLKNARSITAFISEKIEEQTSCALLSEISLLFLSEENPSSDIYQLWTYFLQKKIFTKKSTLGFLIRLFSLLGFFPQFSHASDCQTRFCDSDEIFWEREKGLFLSSQGLIQYKKIPFPLLKVFSFSSKTHPEQLEKITFSTKQEKEIWNIFWWFYQSHSKFFPRSKKLFEEFF